MDSLKNLLKNKSYAAPDEVSLIKDYVKMRWQADCTVQVNRQTIIISAPNSALAATIQMEKQQLIEACGLQNKKLIIRTGQ